MEKASVKLAIGGLVIRASVRKREKTEASR